MGCDLRISIYKDSLGDSDHSQYWELPSLCHSSTSFYQHISSSFTQLVPLLLCSCSTLGLEKRLFSQFLFFYYFILFFNFTVLYWFCHISKWICPRYTCVPHSEPSSLPIPPLWVIPVHQPQASSIVHRTWTGDSFHIWYYTCFNAILPNHPPLRLPQSPKDCSIHLCLFCCLAYRVIVTIFLNSIYMH